MNGIEFRLIPPFDGSCRKDKYRVTIFEETTKKIKYILMSTLIDYTKATVMRASHNKILGTDSSSTSSMYIDEYLVTLYEDTRMKNYGDDTTTGDDRDVSIMFYIEDYDNDDCVINLKRFNKVYYVDSEGTRVDLLNYDECINYDWLD